MHSTVTKMNDSTFLAAEAGRWGMVARVWVVPPGPVFSPRPTRALFSVAGYRAARNRPQYDVSPDGQRFLMILKNTASQVVYVENWSAELLAKANR